MLDISADDIYLPLGSVDIDSSSHDGVQTQMDCVAMHNSDKYAPLNIFMANECQYWIDCHRFKKIKLHPLMLKYTFITFQAVEIMFCYQLTLYRHGNYSHQFSIVSCCCLSNYYSLDSSLFELSPLFGRSWLF